MARKKLKHKKLDRKNQSVQCGNNVKQRNNRKILRD